MKIFGFAGWSGSGKTTLIERLIPLLRSKGLVVSLIKHAHHEFDIDHPGKDSHRHRMAGCQEVLVTSSVRWALMHELRGDNELTLTDAVKLLAPCDLVLVEGFKTAAIAKIEVHRSSVGKTWLYPDDPKIVAVVSDVDPGATLPVFDINDYKEIADYIRVNA